MYLYICKPWLDRIVASLTFLVLSPLLLLIAFILFLVTRKSPLFLQTRVGYQGNTFSIIKFKTMTDERDASGQLLPDHLRAFRFGTLLRGTSLDELPQLINIIKGDMAFVGPRPWIPEQFESLPERYCKKRCSVRPGITGLAQIRGRNNISFYRRLCYDAIYVKRVSPLVDLSLIFQTIRKILLREGIHQCKDAFTNTMGETIVDNDLSIRRVSAIQSLHSNYQKS